MKGKLMGDLSIATWNINGIRARLERVLGWLSHTQVDILCLQETKSPDEKFPISAFQDIGYAVAIHGQKSYNGVAILSKQPINEVVVGLNDGIEESEARLLSATIANITILSAYFPNGQSVASEKYIFKLAWMNRLRERIKREMNRNQPIALCGDFNVVPEPRDSHDPAVWEGGILCSDDERKALGALRELGLHDAFRVARPDDVAYTWWDYRALGFPKNRGLRLDHVFVTKSLSERVRDVQVDREARKGKQPSDHAPLIARFDFNTTPIGF